MNVVLTESQKNAIDKARVWLRSETDQQLFRLFGFAGTGKTTIIKSLVEDLGLKLDQDVLFATLTGKAALVIQRMSGLPARTIHKTIYQYIAANDNEMRELENKIKSLNEFGEDTSKLREQLAALRTPSFVINPESTLYDAELIVLDECSMIDEKVAADILSFGKRVLLIGDPGQLPPIKGSLSGGFGDQTPDVFLDEIHRQALESPILQLATMARKGNPIKYGVYGPTVMNAPFTAVKPKDLVSFNQVICGTHVTRRMLNREMRAAKGYNGTFPSGTDEKIILNRNYTHSGLLNGQFITLSNVTKRDEHRLYADITTEDGEVLLQRSVYSGYFLDHTEYKENRMQEDFRVRSKAIECDFAEAITCHKAQGSQWGNVAVIDDWKQPTTRNRWLYTAITRASEGLMIFRK